MSTGSCLSCIPQTPPVPSLAVFPLQPQHLWNLRKKFLFHIFNFSQSPLMLIFLSTHDHQWWYYHHHYSPTLPKGMHTFMGYMPLFLIQAAFANQKGRYVLFRVILCNTCYPATTALIFLCQHESLSSICSTPTNLWTHVNT